MTTYRRYCFTGTGTWPPETWEKAQEVLERWCGRRWWYTEPQVEGAPFNRLVLTFTVAGRDQWWCHSRAMWLAGKVYRATKIPRAQWPVPDWENLEPHKSRGRWRRKPATPEEESVSI